MVEDKIKALVNLNYDILDLENALKELQNNIESLKTDIQKEEKYLQTLKNEK